MRFLLLVLLFAFQINANARQTGFGNDASVYLVRHAEKERGNDPVLTTAGNKRAGDLARVLKDKGIRHIYVTAFKRTENTGDSMRLQLGIDTIHYIADTIGADLLEKIKLHGDLNNPILIIGHSNTVPATIRRLGIADYPLVYIPDKEFDNLFLLNFKGGKAILTKTRYGAVSATSATMH